MILVKVEVEDKVEGRVRRLGSPSQDQQIQAQIQAQHRQHRQHHRLHRHHRQSSRSPPAPRNFITVLTHRSRKNNTSSTSSTSIHNQPQPGNTRRPFSSTSRPSSFDRAPSSTGSHPLTPLSSISNSNESTSDRRSSLNTPSFSSTDSALPNASISTFHNRSITNQPPSSPARSKATFNMPFRDRVARRFGETVSSGSISDSVQVQDLEYTTSRAFHSEHNESLQLCPLPITSMDVDHVAGILPSIDHKPEPRPGASSGRGLSCASPPTALRHQIKASRPRVRHEAGEDGETFLRKALGPRHSRVRKSAPKTTAWAMATPRSSRRRQVTTGSGSGDVPGPSDRSASHTSRSSSSSTPSPSPPPSVYSNGRRPGARVTRASARLAAANNNVLTDVNGKQLSPTSPYLSYYDVCLTFEDIKSLRNDWLTDNNIAFWEEWLEREILPKYPQARITLLRPSMAYLLMRENCPQNLRPVLPDMTKVTHIFVPVNDAVSRTNPDGSHWSLLLVSKIDGVAFHYDSLGGSNNSDGINATTKLSQLLGVTLRYQAISDCPQQENGNDCGVFVCILMRHLLVKRLLNANAREKVSMSMSNKMIDASGARKEMLKIIESLRKEGERRRSASPYAKAEPAPRIE